MSNQRVFVDVDVQQDFCDPGGALYVKGSPNALYQELTRFAVQRKIPILGSVDSHAWDAWEFASSTTKGPNGERPGFPDHCVKGTPGWLKVPGTLPARFRFLPNVGDAPFHPVVREVMNGQTQGVYFEKEVYSLFANPLAERFLTELVAATPAVEREFFVYGVATDYCVKSAALGLRQRGYATTVLSDAVAGITPAGTRAALAEMAAAGVKFGTAQELLARDRLMGETKKDYPRPSLTADIVVTTIGDVGLRVLFIRRGRDPFAGAWALPGGFVEPTETVAQAAARELEEETGLTGLPLRELGCFSRPGRDPRGWVVSVAHLALVPEDRVPAARAADDAADAAWLDLRPTGERTGFELCHEGAPVAQLAFDHREILAATVGLLRDRVEALAFALLPPEFTLTQARRAFAAICARPIDEARLGRWLVDQGLARELGAGGRYAATPREPCQVLR